MELPSSREEKRKRRERGTMGGLRREYRSEGEEAPRGPRLPQWLRRTAGATEAEYDAESAEAPLLGGRAGENGGDAASSGHRGSATRARRRCCGGGGDEDRNVCYAPLTDMPSNDPDVGPHFRYGVNEMMRMVYEGEGVRKIARYREEMQLYRRKAPRHIRATADSFPVQEVYDPPPHPDLIPHPRGN